MTFRARLLAVALTLVLTAAAFAQSDSGRRARSTPSKPAEPVQSIDPNLIRQLADAQKWAGEQIWHVKAAIEALPGSIAELKEEHAAAQDDLQKAREEVKGLYVELSNLRQELDELRTEIKGVDGNVSGFRTFSGLFIAVMLLLLAVIFMMTLRR